jgi:hypothetical protein
VHPKNDDVGLGSRCYLVSVSTRPDDGEPLAGHLAGGIEGGDPDDHGEARRDYRPPVKFAWPVDIEPLMVGRGARVRATTRGVSIGGAFIVTDLALDPGQPIYLWMHPPGPPPPGAPAVLRFRAEVRWLSDGARRDLPRGFGVAFRALTAADEVALHGYFSRAHKVV